MTGNYILQNAPHVRAYGSVSSLMGDMIIALLPLYLMAYFFYGARALLLGAIGVLTAVITEGALLLITYRKINIRDISSIVTGLIIPLLMPATVPFYVVIAATAVAIAVVKFPFGGTGNNLFNPAAVGFAFSAFCWPNLVFSYPAPMQKLPLFADLFTLERLADSSAQIIMKQSVAGALHNGTVPDYSTLELLLGLTPGPMGATNILVILALGLFLIVRKTVNWRIPYSFLLSCAIMALLFPRIPTGAMPSLTYELMGGTLLFGALFLLPEPVCSPKRDSSKVLFGTASGIIVMLFRHFGAFEEGMLFAILILNLFSPAFDHLTEKILYSLRREGSLVGVIKKLFTKGDKSARTLSGEGSKGLE